MHENPVKRSQASASSDEVVLRAQGLKKAFGGQVVLDGVDLELNRGEVVLLRGENGSGKTTLLNILTGNLEPDSGTIDYLADGTPRTYRFPRRWWQDLNPWDHFRPEFVAQEGMGRTWQDVRLFGSLSIRDNIAVAESGHPGENPGIALIAPGRAAAKESIINRDAEGILASVGLAGRENSSGDMVSLGQSKRVAIARAVAAGAQVLFLDEPLAGLDRKGITDVLTILEKFVCEQNLTLVIIEHVFNFVHLEKLVDVHWQLENGRITKDEVDHLPAVDSIDGIPVTIAPPSWFSQIAGSPDHLTSERLARGAVLTRIRRPDRLKPDAMPVFEIKDLVVKRGQRNVIGLDAHGETAGFNLSLHEGEIAILQAPNGWGKSTLFDAICGNAPASDGSIRLNGSAIESAPPWDRARSGLFPSPSAATLFPSLKVSEVAKLSPNFQASNRSSLPFAERTVSSLSGGEKQRTLLRLALPESNKPGVILLDEPFAMLDKNRTNEAISLISNTKGRSAVLILVPAHQTTSDV